MLPLLFAWTIAGAGAARWQGWLVFRSARSLGVAAPEVGYDLSYHLFRLPFLSVVFAWLMSMLAVAFVMATCLLLLSGSLRFPIHGRRSSAGGLRLLAGVAAAWMFVRAADYWFVKYPALASRRDGRFHGAGYAQLHAPGLALRPLAIAALVTAVLLVVYAAGRLPSRWVMSGVVVVGVAHLVLVVIAPIVIQRLVVLPAEADREFPYLEHNLAGTQTAYGLDTVEFGTESLYDGTTDATEVDRLPLFDTRQLADPLQVLQGTRGTRITDVDLDRYDLDGRTEPVYVAARDSAATELPEQGWVQKHLVYTHGDGVVVSRADELNSAGVLDFADATSELRLDQPDLYFGQGLEGWYVLTGTKRDEVGDNAFSADTGVAIDSVWRRFVAGVALGDFNLIASSELTDDTQLLFRRSLRDRIEAIAPFLTVDTDPYPVIVDEHVVWVIDAYTTSNTYPYSQYAETNGLAPLSPLSSGPPFNYMRRAAVVTVDGYDGTVHVYRADGASGTGRTVGNDPILDAWDRILPGVLEDPASLPSAIARHLRYGDDLFTVQTNMLGRYHVDGAETLFNGSAAWLVSPSAGVSAEDTSGGPSTAVTSFAGTADGAGWVSYRAFSPGASGNPSSAREELAAIAIGDHDTGRLRVITIDSRDGRQITSPRVAQSLIAADPEVSQLFTLLNANGSKVLFGPMTPILTNDSLVWIRPVVVVSSTAGATPRLQSVLAVSDGTVGRGDTASEAIAATRNQG